MLRDAYQKGIEDARTIFNIKEADARSKLTGLRRFAIGDIPEVVSATRKGKLRSLFRGAVGKPGAAGHKPGGILSPKSVLWPTIPGSPVKSWMFRGMAALPALGAIQAVRGKSGDPSESRLSNTLGALGSAAGFMYGIPLGGMIGAPILGGAGHHLGKGIGRMFSKRPEALPPTPQQKSAPETEQRLPVSPYSGGI